jgi:hypothetical protein
MTANGYYLLMIIGVPVAFLLIAMWGFVFHRHDDAEVLDWKPTRSPQREAELHVGDTQEMLDALNRYRRLRGAPERSLEEITEENWASLDHYD